MRETGEVEVSGEVEEMEEVGVAQLGEVRETVEVKESGDEGESRKMEGLLKEGSANVYCGECEAPGGVNEKAVGFSCKSEQSAGMGVTMAARENRVPLVEGR